MAADDQRELKLFPLQQGESSGLLYEDDGESDAWRQGGALWLRWRMRCDAQRITLTVSREGDFRPAWRQLAVTLPAAETRELWINGERASGYTLD